MSDYNRRRFMQSLSLAAAASISGGLAFCSTRRSNKPNIIVVFLMTWDMEI